jgi:hypothetical protein
MILHERQGRATGRAGRNGDRHHRMLFTVAVSSNERLLGRSQSDQKIETQASLRLTDRGHFGKRDACLPVNFNVSSRPAHFMPVKTVALVHVDARSARHALGFAETMVTNLVAHTISLGGHRKKGRKQSDCCSAEKYRAHCFLLITSRGNAFCGPLFRSRTSPGCNAQGHPSRTGRLGHRREGPDKHPVNRSI